MILPKAVVVQIDPPPIGGNTIPGVVEGRLMPDADAELRHVWSGRKVLATGHLREADFGDKNLQFEAVDAETGKKSWYNAHKYVDIKDAPWRCSCGKENWQQRVICRGCRLARPTNSADTPRPVAVAHFEVSCR